MQPCRTVRMFYVWRDKSSRQESSSHEEARLRPWLTWSVYRSSVRKEEKSRQSMKRTNTQPFLSTSQSSDQSRTFSRRPVWCFNPGYGGVTDVPFSHKMGCFVFSCRVEQAEDEKLKLGGGDPSQGGRVFIPEKSNRCFYFGNTAACGWPA